MDLNLVPRTNQNDRYVAQVAHLVYPEEYSKSSEKSNFGEKLFLIEREK